MNKKTRPELGQQCKLTTKLYRKRSYGKRSWESEPIPECTGVYVGWRIRQNGDYNGGYDEYDWPFLCNLKHVEVWLFVTNPRHNSIAVFPGDVEITNE